MKYIDLFEKFVIKQYNNPGMSVQGPGSRPLTKNGFEKIRKQDVIVATDDTIYQIVRDEIKRLGKDADLNHIDVSQVTNMHRLFYLTDFQGDVSQWNVSSVKTMSYMFYGCTKFNQDISKWDISNVTNMNSMFERCTNFNQDISQWDVSSVKYMNDMFNNCQIKDEYKPKFK